MSAVAIIAIAIAATGILLMRFRKRWLAKINIAVTNRITSLAGSGVQGDCNTALDLLQFGLADTDGELGTRNSSSH